MALKTFNIDEQVYKEFSKHCKQQGISMSRRIENFLRDEVEKIKLPIGEMKDLGRERLHHAEGQAHKQTGEHPLSKYC